MKKHDGYYVKVPKRVDDLSHRLKNILENDWINNHEVMTEYFGTYWEEFKTFWKQCGETIDWITFACAPHNSIMFVIYVFKEYPHLMDKIEVDIKSFESRNKNPESNSK